MQSIIKVSDINTKDLNGQTLLYHAIAKDFPESFINQLIKKGINIASRDRFGRTAYDFATCLEKYKYCRSLDDHVLYVVKRCSVERIESLVLQSYKHVPEITDNKGVSIQQYAIGRWSKQLRDLVKNYTSILVS